MCRYILNLGFIPSFDDSYILYKIQVLLAIKSSLIDLIFKCLKRQSQTISPGLSVLIQSSLFFIFFDFFPRIGEINQRLFMYSKITIKNIVVLTLIKSWKMFPNHHFPNQTFSKLFAQPYNFIWHGVCSLRNLFHSGGHHN
mgnify:CR=1 FL=1